jgi:addiction module RelE/StbE family toxin
MKVVWSSGFKRSFKKITKKNSRLSNKIIETLRLLAINPFTPSLKSHKLAGHMEGLWSCSVTYDCRIIFNISEDGQLLEMFILLIDVGSHDEVY